MLKNSNRKNIGDLVKNNFVLFFRFLGKNTWVFTIFFFGAVFVAAVWIWWQCSYRPSPSSAVTIKIEAEKEDFDGMRQETMETITLLQGYRENYNNSDKFGDQRELFVDILDDKVVEKMNREEIDKIEEYTSEDLGEKEIIETQITENRLDDKVDFSKEVKDDNPVD